LRANPVPATGLVNRVRAALRDWLMHGTPPPPSQWPTLKDGNPGGIRQRRAMGFPGKRSGHTGSIFLPENFIFPVFDTTGALTTITARRPAFDEHTAHRSST